MLYLKSFCFNPFQENTYIVYNDELSAWIIDPGNSNQQEHDVLRNFISERKLRPERLLLTHAHVDHILGNRFIFDEYGLRPEVHLQDKIFIERLPETAGMYGISFEESPMPEKYLSEGDVLGLGKYGFECIHTPGHSPGSISFFNRENKILIAGDVLFNLSIGRSDLPMGDHEQLLRSIREKLLVLGSDVKVYPGHGPSTVIGYERENNPFLQ